MSFMQNDVFVGDSLRQPRRHRLLRGTFSDARTADQPLLVRNISARGMGMAAREKAPRLGEAVTIRLADFPPIAGTVRWVEGKAFGVALAEELDLEALARAVQQHSGLQTAAAPDWQVARLHRVAPGSTPTNLRRV